MQPYILNIPFFRWSGHKQGATIAQMERIYRENGFPLPPSNAGLLDSEYYDDIRSRGYVVVPRDLRKYFLYGTTVELPNGEPMDINSESDLAELSQYCPRGGQPCLVTEYVDRDGELQDALEQYGGRVRRQDWSTIFENRTGDTHHWWLKREMRESEPQPTASDKDFIRERGGFDPTAGLVSRKNIITGPRKRKETMAVKRSRRSEKLAAELDEESEESEESDEVSEEQPQKKRKAAVAIPVSRTRPVISQQKPVRKPLIIPDESDDESEGEEPSEEYYTGRAELPEDVYPEESSEEEESEASYVERRGYKRRDEPSEEESEESESPPPIKRKRVGGY